MSKEDMPTDSEPQFDLAAVTEAKNKGVAEGFEAGAKAENERIKSILSLEEAQGRESIAKTLAFKKGLTAEDAKEILASTPKAASDFDSVMSNIKNPNVGNDMENPMSEDQKRSSSWDLAIQKTLGGNH